MDGLSVCRSVQCRKTADLIRIPFGLIGRTGPGVRQVAEFGDRPWEGVLLGGEFGACHCNQWGLTFAAMRPSSQITLGRLVIIMSQFCMNLLQVNCRFHYSLLVYSVLVVEEIYFCCSCLFIWIVMAFVFVCILSITACNYIMLNSINKLIKYCKARVLKWLSRCCRFLYAGVFTDFYKLFCIK